MMGYMELSMCNGNNIIISFEYRGKTYTQNISINDIDTNHYEEIWDYWFEFEVEDFVFELTGTKCDNKIAFIPNEMYINVYEDEDADEPMDIITNIKIV